MKVYVSASSLEDYLSCKRKLHYRFNYSGEKPDSRESIIGRVVHSSLESSWNDQSMAMRLCRESLGSFGIFDAEALSFSNTCIDNFFRNFAQFCTESDEKEYGFRLALAKDVFLVGRIDRITPSGLFDWKTKRRPVTNIDNSVQFIIYNWAYKKLFSKSPVGVYFADLPRGNLIKFRENLKTEEILFQQIVPEFVSDVLSGNFSPTGIFNKSCFRCFYSKDCLQEIYRNDKEFYSGSRTF